jgi:hypothetical protein
MSAFTLRSLSLINGLNAGSSGRVGGGDYYPPPPPGELLLNAPGEVSVQIPNGLLSFGVEVYGGGGAGASGVSGTGGAGGGGGGYAKCVIGAPLYAPGVPVVALVGGGGFYEAPNEGVGGPSKLTVGATVALTGGGANPHGSGGFTSVTVAAGISGKATESGTDGDVSEGAFGGFGGAAGGPAGGAGGPGGAGGAAGSPGTAPGGGGGGGGNAFGGSSVGGNGRVRIFWPPA